MICPSCGHDNLAGMDQCDNCSASLMQFDVPQPTEYRMQKSLLTDPVERILRRKNPTRVKPLDTMDQALKSLQETGHGCVLVEEKGTLVGILSERDVLYKVAGKTEDLKSVTVREVMTPSPVTLARDASIGFALNKMAVGGFRHLPVVSSRKTLGVISIRDVLVFLGKGI